MKQTKNSYLFGGVLVLFLIFGMGIGSLIRSMEPVQEHKETVPCYDEKSNVMIGMECEPQERTIGNVLVSLVLLTGFTSIIGIVLVKMYN